MYHNIVYSKTEIFGSWISWCLIYMIYLICICAVASDQDRFFACHFLSSISEQLLSEILFENILKAVI